LRRFLGSRANRPAFQPAFENEEDFNMSTEPAGGTILVVDDDEAVGESIQRLLICSGYEADRVTSAEQALSVFRPGKFGLVITDYEMPGIKGDDLAAAIRAGVPRQPIMILTGFLEKVMAYGTPAADLVMSKPFGVRELLGAVSSLLQQAGKVAT
jgi:DNA-binding response OmpR family regulator